MPVTGQTITEAQLLRLRDAILDEMDSIARSSDRHLELEELLGHVTTALGWRRPPKRGSRTESAAIAAAEWNRRNPAG